jgi:hypothetical protein
MKIMRTPLLVGLMGSVTLAIFSACAVTGVGVDGSVGVDYGYPGAYYEPYGYDYGGWGGGYRVGPSRGHGDDRHDHGDGRRDVGGGRDVGGRGGGHAPAYRPAPQGRSAPSIPGRSRGH